MLLSGLTLAACLLVAASVRADPAPVSGARSVDAQPSREELERARVLFQKGVELANQGQFAAAEARFRGAMAIHPAPAVEYNLAAALFELHKYEEAFNRNQTVLHDPETPATLRERAEALERALQPRVARLTVVASSQFGDLTVRVDGEPLPASMMGLPRAVAPGVHTIVAERPQGIVVQRTVDVPLQTAALVDLSLFVASEPSASAPSAELSPSESAARDDSRSLRKRRMWLWGGVAVGVLAVGVALGVGLSLARRDPGTEAAAAGDFQPGVLTWR